MPLPPGARAGTLPNGTLVWIDANGQPINADGTPMANAPAATPLAPAPNTAASSPTSTQTAPTTTSVDIAPPGSAAAPRPAPAPSTTATTTGPAAGPPAPGQPSSGGYSVAQITAPYQQELLDAHQAVTDIQTDISKAQARIDYLTTDAKGKQEAVSDPTLLTSATSELNAKYGAMSSALGRVQTANATLAKAVTDTIHDGTVDPGQVQVANATVGKANADANEATVRAKVLLDGSDNQKALTAAQATLASANAGQANATALATTAKTPAEIDQLKAQATALKAQADSTTAMIGPLVEKTQAETKLLGSQSDVAQSQVTLNQAQAASQTADVALKGAQTDFQRALVDAGLPAAQTAQAAGAGAASQATAAQTLADIQQKKLGPVYGLQDQLAAIKSIHDQVFGPGGSGTPDQRRQQADDLLGQFFNATVGGTTPYAASVAAENANLTGYGTQMSGVNALQAAQASRASSYAGLAGSELGTLAGMNAYAPKGSTSMADAFQYLQDDMAKRMATQFPTAAIPNAPAMPSFLQQFANPATGGPAGPGGAPVTAGAPVGAAAGAPGVVPGGGPVFNPQGSTAAMNTAGFMDTPAGRAAMAAANPALLASRGTAPAAPVAAGGSMPASIANYAAPGGGLTPQQAFAQGFSANTPTFPNVLQMYGLNMPNPMTLLGGQPYVGMPV